MEFLSDGIREGTERWEHPIWLRPIIAQGRKEKQAAKRPIAFVSKEERTKARHLNILIKKKGEEINGKIDEEKEGVKQERYVRPLARDI